MDRIELAKTMTRDAKAFYKRYTAGTRPSQSDIHLMTSFGVWLHNERDDQLARLRTELKRIYDGPREEIEAEFIKLARVVCEPPFEKEKYENNSTVL